MKNLIRTTLVMFALSVASLQVSAQDEEGIAGKKSRNFSINFHTRSSKDSVSNKQSNYFTGGITFTRLDIGFSRMIDNGSFSLSQTNDFLNYQPGKTSTVSFDILQLGYRFNQNFKMYLAGGFDWNNIRLKNDITIQKNSNDLTYIQEPIHFSKNKLASSYVHIPFNFEIRTNENARGKRFYAVFGPEIGFLLNGKVKQISEERGKVKLKDDYNFQPFRYGGTVRLGYGSLAVFSKYYFNDMFDTPQQKGLKNMSFGVTFGLN